MSAACLILALHNILRYRTVYKKVGLSLDRFQPRNGDGNRKKKQLLASIGGPAFQSAAMRSPWRSKECNRVDQADANAVLSIGQDGVFIEKWGIRSAEFAPASAAGAITSLRTVRTHALHSSPITGPSGRAYHRGLLRWRRWAASSRGLWRDRYKQPSAVKGPRSIARESLARGGAHAA